MQLCRNLFLAASFVLLSSCAASEDGAVDAVWIGSQEELLESGLRLSAGAQHVRAATQYGLVTRDSQGEVIPALAERWIVTEDGLSYIFRLREENWPNGEEMTSESVRRALRRNLRALAGTSLGLDLAPINDVRAMTGRVIEIQLSAPLPDLLTLLAQPELALRSAEGGTGPMEIVGQGQGESILLRFKPPSQRGLPEAEDWQEDVRDLNLHALPAQEAIARFEEGRASLVLGGRIGHLPLADTGPLSRGTVQIDPAIGLFGLQIMQEGGILADIGLREALAMSIDRPALMARYNLGGWVPTTRVLAPGLPGDTGQVSERWQDQSLEDRRLIATGRLRSWLAGKDEEAREQSLRITIDIGQEPGLDLLFRELATQFATIGVTLVRADEPGRAQLALVDQVARYAHPAWFLNQFHCSLRRGLCDEGADYLLELAQETRDPAESITFLAEAEAELTRANIYIPFGAPLRWSLVRSNVAGFSPNRFATHPLPQLAEIPK